ncbi:hypothetical protein [Pseudomonas tremae]|jgi:hypothetical protein|uniref:hypothetical protein n=1 Tax=Pseudomonas tremae TaxID=200454 RepID=UPI001F3487C5|nr:hypothetical protein [Pseudomonas tremae]MCF5803935.1 hypothetical protein [Pseudomonas tremae]MCF5810235.1 hypothetical protein [Pseudomonas tremae]
MFYAGVVGIQRNNGGICLINSLTAQEGRVRLIRLATGAVRTAKTEDIKPLQPQQFAEQFSNYMSEVVATHSSAAKLEGLEKPVPKSTLELAKRYLEIVRCDSARNHESYFLQEFIISSVWCYEAALPFTSRVITVSKIQNIFGYLELNCPSKSLLYSRFVNLKRSIASGLVGAPSHGV